MNIAAQILGVVPNCFSKLFGFVLINILAAKAEYKEGYFPRLMILL